MMTFVFIGDMVKTWKFAAATTVFLSSADPSYTTAALGADLGASDNFMRVGQVTDGTSYMIWQAGIGFDTSSLSGKTLQSVKLILTPGIINPDLSFYVDVYAHDYGTAIDEADWQDLTDLAALTPLLARKSNTDFVPGPNEFVSTPDFLAAVNKTGVTKLWLASSENIGGAPPFSEEKQFVSFFSNEEPDTLRRPQLVVTTL